MTEKLYYKDSHIKEFEAKVKSCTENNGRFEIVLDRTAFFPEGGGQLADTGYIGEARVTDAHEKSGEVVHYADISLEEGKNYKCAIDWEQRFRRMQNHTGEHIVSGLVHRKFGFDNVGFHMGKDAVTIDFNGEMSFEQLLEIEREANYIVAAGKRVICEFPEPEELENLSYRSKLELTENVRIVTIEDTDCCACCAPHLYSTSEVGLIKVLSMERRRRGGEGVRISMLCGLDAYDDYVTKQNNAMAVSNLLSAPQDNIVPAVERLLSENEKQKIRVSEISMKYARMRAENAKAVNGNICIFEEMLDEPALREIVNVCAKKCDKIAAVFSGNDESGYRYIIGSGSLNLRDYSKEINAALSGRGGGSAEMIQGSCSGKSETIQNYIEKFRLVTH